MEFITEMFKGVEGADETVIEKAKVLVEAQINEMVQAKVEEITEKEIARLDEKFEEAKTEYIAEATDNVSEFLDAIIVEWAKENAVAIDNKVKGEIGVELVGMLKEAFEKSSITLPEVDVEGALNEAQENVTALQEELKEAQRLLAEASAEILLTQKKEVISEVTAGLALTQVDRIAKLAESFEFTTKDEFKQKVETLAEAIAGKDKGGKKGGGDDEGEGAEVVNKDDEGKKKEGDDDTKVDESTLSIQEQTMRFLNGK